MPLPQSVRHTKQIVRLYFIQRRGFPLFSSPRQKIYGRQIKLPAKKRREWSKLEEKMKRKEKARRGNPLR